MEPRTRKKIQPFTPKDAVPPAHPGQAFFALAQGLAMPARPGPPPPPAPEDEFPETPDTIDDPVALLALYRRCRERLLEALAGPANRKRTREETEADETARQLELARRRLENQERSRARLADLIARTEAAALQQPIYERDEQGAVVFDEIPDPTGGPRAVRVPRLLPAAARRLELGSASMDEDDFVVAEGDAAEAVAQAEAEDRADRAVALAELPEAMHECHRPAVATSDEVLRGLGLRPGTACHDLPVGGDLAMPHQQVPARFLARGALAHAGLLLGHNTGEGKTLAAVVALRCLSERIAAELGTAAPPARFLVCVPVSTLHQWRAALDGAGLGDRSVVLPHSLFDTASLSPAQWKNHDPRLPPDVRRLAAAKPDPAPPAPDERAPEERAAAAKMVPMAGAPVVLVVDEVHLMASDTTRRTRDTLQVKLDSRPSAKARGMFAMAQRASFALTLSATPLRSSAADAAVPLAVALTTGLHAPGQFRLRTKYPPLPADQAVQAALRAVRAALATPPELDSPDLDRLRGGLSFRGIPADPCDPRPAFPLVHWRVPLVPMSEADRQAYQASLEADRTSGAMALHPNTRRALGTKLEWVVDTAVGLITSGRFGIVCLFNLDSAKAVAERLEEHPQLVAFRDALAGDELGLGSPPEADDPTTSYRIAAVMDGGDKAPARQASIKRFNRHRLMCLVVTDAGATGVNLANCEWVVLADMQWSRAKAAQFAARGVRFGSHDALPPAAREVVVLEPVSVFPDAVVPPLPLTLAEFKHRFSSADDTTLTTDAQMLRTALRVKDQLDWATRRLCEVLAIEHGAGMAPCGGAPDPGPATDVGAWDGAIPAPSDRRSAWAAFAPEAKAAPRL